MSNLHKFVSFRLCYTRPRVVMFYSVVFQMDSIEAMDSDVNTYVNGASDIPIIEYDPIDYSGMCRSRIFLCFFYGL